MNTVTIIVQFIGLCVFTNNLPNDPGVHVILPRIGVPSSTRGDVVAKLDRKTEQQAIARMAITTTGVEDHIAMIAFPAGSFHSATGWIPMDLPSAPGYKYVRLDGERVSFQTKGGNSPLTTLPALPKLATCCPAMGKLRPEFLKPYTGAAAVFDLPNGVLASCTADTPGANGRVDTALLLDNTGTFFVVNGTKKGAAYQLSLKSNPALVVYVGNIPIQWANQPHEHYQNGGLPHYQAYYDMGDHQGTGRTCDPLGNCMPAGIPSCLASVLRQTGGNSRHLPPPTIMSIATSECSNSQWP